MYESGLEDGMWESYNNRSPHEGQIVSRSVTVSLQAGHGSENGNEWPRNVKPRK